MSIEEQINEMRQNVANSYVKVKSKGGTLPNDRNLANLPDAIDSISGGGGGANLGFLYADHNDTYNPADFDLDGFSSVEVNVPQSSPILGNLYADQNNTSYFAQDYGYDGFDSVTVEVQAPATVGIDMFKNKTARTTIDGTSNTWVLKNWTIENNITASCFWTDGDRIFYSSGAKQFLYDETNDTWVNKTWTGWATPNGSGIWYEGNHIYCSVSGLNYEFDKTTDTWTSNTWYGLTNFEGRDTWTYKGKIYYSDTSSTDTYELDIATDTWTLTTHQAIGRDIWTIGNKILQTTGSINIFDGTNWNYENLDNLPNPLVGRFVWTDGKNFYYDSPTFNYHALLDMDNKTYTNVTWTGLNSGDTINGLSIFKIKDKIYCSASSRVYELQRPKYLTTRATL